MPKEPVEWAAVYLAKFGNMVKVGLTNDPAARLRTLQTGLPEALTMPYLVVLPKREQAVRLEKSLHRQMADRRVRGEWFRIDIEDAIAIAERSSGRMRPYAMRGLPPIQMDIEATRRLSDEQLNQQIKELVATHWPDAGSYPGPAPAHIGDERWTA